MLNAHPIFSCHEENIYLSKLATTAPHWYANNKEPMRLLHAGISKEIVESALGAYILETIGFNRQKHNICNYGNTGVLKHVGFFSKLLPNTKFILMIRDPRASIKKMILSNNEKYNESLVWNMSSQFKTWNVIRCI